MPARPLIGLIALAAALAATMADSRAWDDAKYPDLKGAWRRPGAAQWDPTKPSGLRQEAPLTPEYRAVLEANIAEIRSGGQSHNPQARCLPGGMPRVMIAYDPLQFIVTPGVTYMRSDHLTENRRIYTDGRDWPASIRPSFHGYSIGQWLDTDGDGTYDTLEIETRHMKGPRAVDNSGIPLHEDNATVVKERMYLDKGNPNILHNENTIIDNAFTRPWTAMKNYRRLKNELGEDNCNENNNHVEINKEIYYLSSDGYLMPAKKGQRPPDLRYFTQK